MGTNDHVEKKSKGSTKRTLATHANSGYQWHGFVNVSLTDAVKKKWFDWAARPEQFFAALEQMIRDGYKVTIKHEERTDAFSAFVTPASGEHQNSGWGLSERAGDPYTALNRVVYIHAVVLGGDWDSYKFETGYADTWG